MLVVPLLCVALAAAARALDLTEVWTAVATVPAVLWIPGRGIAGWLGGAGLRREVDAVWISVALAVVSVALARWTGTGGWGVLAASLTWGLIGPSAPPWRPGAPLVAAALVLAATAFAWRADIARPMERYWYFEPAESALSDAGLTPTPGLGWAATEQFDDAWKLTPRQGDPYLLGPVEAPVVLALRGPVGAQMWVDGRPVRIHASVVEASHEGPVRRYLERGVAGTVFTRALDSGERLDLLLSHPEDSTVYVLGKPDALWSLDASGELRFVHYFQLLNMVEQIDWARERLVTDVQPPLWTPVLGAAIAVTEGDLPTANVLFFSVLLLGVAAGFLFIEAWVPSPPPLVWLLPLAAAVVHARLMLVPASAAMPDSLYAVAIVMALSRRWEPFGLAAQLLRYPGSAVVLVGSLLAGEWRRGLRMLAVVAATAALFGVGGWLTGNLDDWMKTVAWESGPEHWHGNYDPVELIGRAPAFYLLWLVYAGCTPLLAALRWPAGTRVALGTALGYSLLLCTIDHSPTHYFLPLLHLSALATATTAAAFTAPLLRHGLPLLGSAGLLTFALYGAVE